MVMIKVNFALLLITSIFGVLVFFNDVKVNEEQIQSPLVSQTEKLSSTSAPKITLSTPSPSKILQNDYHIFQTFNNCGPASLSMALSHFGINVSQYELGQQLRPYQIPSGNNDDKSVTLEELAEKSEQFKLIPYHRPNGSIEHIKLFITYDMPVITRTLTKKDEDIGHYRIVKGYDSTKQYIIQDDSLQGKNLKYSYADFNALWKKFNYEYLVLVPEEKKDLAEAILGEDLDTKIAWQKAVRLSQDILHEGPDDIIARFNLSVAFYNTHDYQKSIEEFEKVENKLSFRTLWYQIEPIKAYYQLGNYKRVFEITDRILNNHNRAFSELYLLRGQIYLKLGQSDLARGEFEKASLYNQTFIKKIPQF